MVAKDSSPSGGVFLEKSAGIKRNANNGVGEGQKVEKVRKYIDNHFTETII